MSRNSSLAALLVSILAATVAICGCDTKTAQTAPMFAVPVTVAKATQQNIPVNLTAIGSASAYSTVSVESQVNAELEEVHIKEGQFVKKGDLLFTLDARPFQAALDQAQANLAKDEAQSQLDQVQAQRYEELYKEGVGTKEQYDQQQSTYQAQQAAVHADQAAVVSAQLQVSYCEIYSPVSGRTGALQVYPGNIVKADSTPALIVINQLNPIYMSFSVPQQYLGDVQKFMARGPLRVEATPYGETKPEIGYLSFVDNSVDNTTGTVALKATFQNTDYKLWPGQFSNVLLRLAEEENATVVPTQAVQTGQNGDYVYVVTSDMTVEQHNVKIGRSFGPDTVVLSGVQPGATVVTDGQLRLIPGVKVQVSAPVTQS
ncbi:MAG: efflux RND transporter periplasmic adaptor subunit [Candidatus Acidiferrales bacterium]